MLELSLVGIIGLAAVYAAAMWWMGRHSDVLYGDFVSPEGAASLAPAKPASLRQPQTAAVMGRTRKATARPPVATREALPPVRTAAHPPPRTSAVPPRPAPPALNIKSQPAGNRLTTAKPLLPAPLPPVTPSAQHRSPSRSIPAPARSEAPAHNDVLNSLLETIKHDLNNAVGKS